jgi:predicted O-methyltransferase YrrM
MPGRALAALSDEEFVERLYAILLFRAADAPGRAFMLGELGRGVGRLDLIERFLRSDEFREARRWLAFAPPGHFNSPLPSAADVEHHRGLDWNPPGVPGIDLREEAQLALLEALAAHYADIPFGDQPGPRTRYGYRNPSYAEADGTLLYAMIRHLRPRRVIEVGSGYSSCAILDAADRLEGGAEVTFIEPYPETLRARVWPGDLERHRLVEGRLQDTPLEIFEALEARDILFVDSSHVAKLNSDVNYLVFRILPALAPGVFVHFHDVFYPFEYPMAWYEEGRAWNEAFLVRAFLQFNDAWRIELFSNFMFRRHWGWFRERMPVTIRDAGGQLWISRVR